MSWFPRLRRQGWPWRLQSDWLPWTGVGNSNTTVTQIFPTEGSLLIYIYPHYRSDTDINFFWQIFFKLSGTVYHFANLKFLFLSLKPHTVKIFRFLEDWIVNFCCWTHCYSYFFSTNLSFNDFLSFVNIKFGRIVTVPVCYKRDTQSVFYI